MTHRTPLAMLAHIVALAMATGFGSGCAVHYFDPETGAEHMWGVGHLVMKATPSASEPLQAIVTGSDTVGISAGHGPEGTEFATGWTRRRRVQILDENAAVVLEWPTASFLNLRVGEASPEHAAKSFAIPVEGDR